MKVTEQPSERFMRMKPLGMVALALGMAMMLGGAPSRAQDKDKLSEEEALKLGTDAYIYGYPLVYQDLARRMMTNTSTPEGALMRAPMGQFVHNRQFATPAFREVQGPNVDTLYSSAWLDLAMEPYVLSIPDSQGRYFLVPLIDGWGNVFQVPGSRTTGTKAQTFAITGPNWKGKLPKSVTEYKSPTSIVWIVGRTYCTGTPADYEAAHAFQDKLSLVPLSAYGKDYTPPKGQVDPNIDMKMRVSEQVSGMGAGAFFKLLAALMKDNPPNNADAPVVAELAGIGVVPGQDFDIGKLDPAVAASLVKAPKAALEKIQNQAQHPGKIVNGWGFLQPVGDYGTDYLQRAYIGSQGGGLNIQQDAVYPLAKVDGEGKTLNGANKYVVHFAKGGLPPVKGFWSVTLYDAELFLVANPLDRYELGTRTKFKVNPDGSIDLYVQNENPGKDKEANWLPAPKGDFLLWMRLYWPKESKPSILDGTPPPVVKGGD
jgi:hypothetical protein